MTIKGKKWVYPAIWITLGLIAVIMLSIPSLEVYLLYFIFPCIIIPTVIGFNIYRLFKRRVRFAPHLAYDFKESLQYTILEERDLTAKEAWEAFDPIDDGLPSSFPNIAYKDCGRRYFRVENPNGYQFELIVTVIQTWQNKFRYRIESTSRIRE